MPPVNTRDCTEVFTGPPPPGTVFRFTSKAVERVNRFYQRVFTSDDRHEGDPILASLNQRLEEEKARKRESKKQRRLVPKLPQPSRKEKVNKKREFIKRVLTHQANLNLREVARYTKSCWNTVKSVRNEILIHGQLTPYEYNFLKTPEELTNLHQTIEEVQDTGRSVTDIKRTYPTFSKSKIRQVLTSYG